MEFDLCFRPVEQNFSVSCKFKKLSHKWYRDKHRIQNAAKKMSDRFLDLVASLGCESGHSSKWTYYSEYRKKKKRFTNTRKLAKVRITSYFNAGHFAGRLFKMKSVLSRFRFLRNNAMPGGNVWHDDVKNIKRPGSIHRKHYIFFVLFWCHTARRDISL